MDRLSASYDPFTFPKDYLSDDDPLQHHKEAKLARNLLICRIAIGFIGTLMLGVAWTSREFRAYVLNNSSVKPLDQGRKPVESRVAAAVFGTLAFGIPWFFSSYSSFVLNEKHRKIDPKAVRTPFGELEEITLPGPFYHCTGNKSGEKNLKSILNDKKVHVMHKGAHKGAFVSQRPEFLGYGPIACVFTDAITKHKDGSCRSYLKKITGGPGVHWIGFAKPIPTKHLAGIILDSNVYNEKNRAELEKDVEQWAKRKIIVELSNNLDFLRPEVIDFLQS